MAELMYATILDKFGELKELLKDRGRENRDILDLLEEIYELIAKRQEPEKRNLVNWQIVLPRLWWAITVAALAASQVPLSEAIKIASRLF